jgi:WD40 repeat protein
MTASLLDQFCAQAHSGPITGAACDAESGAAVVADELGTVAITRPGDQYPQIVFEMGAPVRGAVAVSQGGALVAVGDDNGTVAVYKTWDGSCVFEDVKEGPGGAARAMRAVAFNPAGTQLATLSIDGIVRIFDIGRWERISNYQGFGGDSLGYDARGERLLVVDSLGQPKLIDLPSSEQIDLELVPGGVRVAQLTPDGKHVVAMGQSGISLIGLPDGRILQSFNARGSSGMLSICIQQPSGRQLAAITGRSVHLFDLPELQPVGSEKHGAPEPTTASMWDARGVAVGGSDGLIYRANTRPSMQGVVCCGGFGDHRVAIHGDKVAVWERNHQKRPFQVKHRFVEVRIDRDGRLLVGLPEEETGLQVFEARSGRHLFDGGPDTIGTPKFEVGGPIVAAMMSRGGLKWYDLKSNSQFVLPWVTSFSLSGSGTWLGVTTPKGQVKVLDPATGKDAVPPPQPLAEFPTRQIAFVNRRPDMLVLDDQGVLGVYDLTESVNEQKPAVGRDILDLNVAVDRLWGITGGQYAAVRFQEPENGTATVIFVDLGSKEVVSEVSGLLPYAWVDPETGSILQPARGAAILELDMHGKESRVLRALPEGEWIAFGAKGILEASDGVRR